MDFADLILKRKSIRIFRPDPLPEGALDTILDAVRLAPTAGNVQAFRIQIVRAPEMKRDLAKAAFQQAFIAEAPVILAFFAAPAESAREYGDRGRNLYALQDATIATLYAHLAAADLGLGSVWIGAFDTPTVARVLDSPGDLLPVALLPIGLPGENPEARPRKALPSLVWPPSQV